MASGGGMASDGGGAGRGGGGPFPGGTSAPFSGGTGAPFSGEVSRERIVERIRAQPLGGAPAAMRAAFERLVLGEARDPFDAPHGRGARSVLGAPVLESADGLSVLPRVDPAAEGGGERYRPDRQVVWLHGGGYVFGAPETHLRPAARLATLASAPVFLPRLRLAPEHPWPAPLADALRVARGAIGGGARVVLAGDSAGGHLALVAALALAREGRAPAGLLLMSPNTDRTGRSATRAAMDADDPMVGDAGDRRLAAMAFGDRPADDREVSPLLDDLSLLPPTHVEVGNPEVLLDDARLLVEAARGAGARATLHVEPGFLHMGQLWAPWWPPAEASLARLADHASRVWSGPRDHGR